MNPIDVQKHLKGASYPASKDDLVATAEGNGAPAELLEALRGADVSEFSGPDQVMKTLSG